MELKDTNLTNEDDYSTVDNQEVEGADSKEESEAGEAGDTAVEHTGSIEQEEVADSKEEAAESKEKEGPSFFDKVKGFITDPKNKKLLMFIGIGVAAFLILFFTIGFIPKVKYEAAPKSTASMQYLASGKKTKKFMSLALRALSLKDITQRVMLKLKILTKVTLLLV